MGINCAAQKDFRVRASTLMQTVPAETHPIERLVADRDCIYPGAPRGCRDINMGGQDLKLRSRAAAAALAFATIATCGSALAAPPHKTQAPAPFLVVDSDGKTVGRLLGETSVVVDLNGVPTVVGMLGQSQNSNDMPTDWDTTDFRRVPLFFASPDCTGPAYARHWELSAAAGLRRAAMVADSAGRRYLYPSVSGVRGYRDINSMYVGACVSSPGMSEEVFSLGAPVEVTTQFKAPFHIK